MSIVNPGDEVVIPDPGFPTYTNMVNVAGGKCVMCPLDKEGRCFDMQALANALNDKTRLLVVNSPSNPTGGVMTSDELHAIAALLAPYPKCWVISDEIYSRLVYGGMNTAPSMLQIPEIRNRLVVVDGFSKTYCMTGWRLGFAVAPPVLVDRLHLLMTHSLGCTAAFTQVAGIEALTGPQVLQEMLQEYEKRRDYVVGRLNAIPNVSCPTPAGAFYVFPDISALGLPCEKVANLLLHEGGVATLPGTDFGPNGQGHIRLSYVRDMDTLKEGLDRITKVLAKLQK